jgi:hypothetical protein
MKVSRVENFNRIGKGTIFVLAGFVFVRIGSDVANLGKFEITPLSCALETELRPAWRMHKEKGGKAKLTKRNMSIKKSLIS